MAIKAKELAQLLGVSTATVSLVLNHKPGICEGTRRQLTQRIIDMGYGYMLRESGPIPAGGGRGTLAYVLYPPESPEEETYTLDPAVLRGAEAAAREAGCDLKMVCVTPETDLRACLCPCAGFVVQKASMTQEDLALLSEPGVPFVLVDTYHVDLPASSVSVNNEQGVYRLVEYLREMGHERIGYIACGADRASFRERERCWENTLRRMGLPVERQWQLAVECPENDLTADLDALKASGLPQPTAYLCDDDMVAWRAIKAFERYGLRVPEDVSVAGFDDRELCTMIEPNLTTIRVPAALLGRESVNLLLQRIRHADRGEEDCQVKLELSVELVPRASVKKLK